MKLKDKTLGNKTHIENKFLKLNNKLNNTCLLYYCRKVDNCFFRYHNSIDSRSRRDTSCEEERFEGHLENRGHLKAVEIIV